MTRNRKEASKEADDAFMSPPSAAPEHRIDISTRDNDPRAVPAFPRTSGPAIGRGTAAGSTTGMREEPAQTSNASCSARSPATTTPGTNGSTPGRRTNTGATSRGANEWSSSANGWHSSG